MAMNFKHNCIQQLRLMKSDKSFIVECWNIADTLCKYSGFVLALEKLGKRGYRE